MSTSEEVIEFLTAFSKLRHLLDDEPRNLRNDSIRDEDIRSLCVSIDSVSNFIVASEKKHPELFSAPVDPSFIKNWRDFERRYQSGVSEVAFAVFWDSLSGDSNFEASLSEVEAWAAQHPDEWLKADSSAARKVEEIEIALDFAESNADQDWRFESDAEEHIEDVKAGLKHWQSTFVNAGFDLRGALRRRELVPFVNITPKISNRGSTKSHSQLLRNLDEAQQVFVYGLHAASLAIMRATLEVLLNDYFKVIGGDLEAKLRFLKDRPPIGVSIATLQKLRIEANLVLHSSTANEAGSVKARELSIVHFLQALRDIIESVR